MPCSVRACAVHVVTVGTTKACKRAAGPAFIGRRIRVVFSYVECPVVPHHGQCFTMRWSITKCRLSSVSCYCQEQRLPCAWCLWLCRVRCGNVESHQRREATTYQRHRQSSFVPPLFIHQVTCARPAPDGHSKRALLSGCSLGRSCLLRRGQESLHSIPSLTSPPRPP